jgi:hypothetical protein
MRDWTLRFREGPDAPVANPSAPRCAQLLLLTGRAGRAETASGPASGHASGHPVTSFRLRFFAFGAVENRRFTSTKTPLYRSNSTAFTNVLTLPSVHHLMLVC